MSSASSAEDVLPLWEAIRTDLGTVLSLVSRSTAKVEAVADKACENIESSELQRLLEAAISANNLKGNPAVARLLEKRGHTFDQSTLYLWRKKGELTKGSFRNVRIAISVLDQCKPTDIISEEKLERVKLVAGFQAVVRELLTHFERATPDEVVTDSQFDVILGVANAITKFSWRSVSGWISWFEEFEIAFSDQAKRPPEVRKQMLDAPIGVEQLAEWGCPYIKDPLDVISLAGILKAVRSIITGVEYDSSPPKRREFSPDAQYRPFTFPANSTFIDHQHRLPKIEDLVQTTGVVAVVIHGMWGCGKSMLARQYAEVNGKYYQHIIWINADCDNLIQELGRHAAPLKILSQPSTKPDDDGRHVLTFLNQPGEALLLILDNVRDAESVRGLIPHGGRCRTLITSRYAAWPPSYRRIECQLWSKEEATDFFFARTKQLRTDETAAVVTGIISELGSPVHAPATECGEELVSVGELQVLPLACENVAAFILEEMSMTFVKYLQKLRDVEFQQMLLDRHHSGTTEYPASIAKTWHVTEAVLFEVAKDVVKVMSLLAPDEIPRDLLHNTAKHRSPSYPSALIDDGLRELVRYSVIRRGSNGDMFSLHRLTQMAVRHTSLRDDEEKLWLTALFEALNYELPFVSYPPQDVFYQYSQHIRSVKKYWENSQDSSRAAAQVFLKTAVACVVLKLPVLTHEYLVAAGSCIQKMNDESTNERWLIALCSFCHDFMIEMVPLTNEISILVVELITAGNSLYLGYTSGCFNLAIVLLRIIESPSHDSQMRRMYADAVIYALEAACVTRTGSQSAAYWSFSGYANCLRADVSSNEEKPTYFDRAIEAYNQSLTIRPNDADTVNNLGVALDSRGRASSNEEKPTYFDRAIEAYNQSLTSRPNHADTLNNIGAALYWRSHISSNEEKTTYFDRAIEAYSQSLTSRPNHADTLKFLGIGLTERGHMSSNEERSTYFDRAIEAYNQSLTIRPNDPETLACLGSALALRGHASSDLEDKLNSFDKAIKAFRRSHKIQSNDVSTLICLVNSLFSRYHYSTTDERGGVLTEVREMCETAMRLDAKNARYNYTCVLALEEKHDECLDQLTIFFEERPETRENVASDLDYESLANNPKFLALIAPYTWNPKHN